MKTTWPGIYLCMAFACSAFAYPTVFPTGITIYKPDKAFNGYTLLNINGCTLIDMNGRKVHGWDVTGLNWAPRLTKQGHLVVAKKNKLFKYDWDGSIIWQLQVPERIRPGGIHHAIEIADNGEIAFIAREFVPEKYAKLITDPVRKPARLVTDALLIASQEGKLIWEWHVCENFDINTDYDRRDYIVDWSHTNTVQILPENRWYEKGHGAFRPGNVLFNPRNFNRCYIIDRQSKKIVWDYRGDFAGGMAHSHGTLMIEKPILGAGNIMVFDNGLFPPNQDNFAGQTRQGQSFVLEVDPIKKEVVWSYPVYVREHGSPDTFKFFSLVGGYCQRLPNGNTLIFETEGHRIFEVTLQQEIVWEWVGYARGFLKRYSYDYCPQLKALPKPKELAVTPPKNDEWHLVPDALGEKECQKSEKKG